jgi:hypothetical protein
MPLPSSSHYRVGAADLFTLGFYISCRHTTPLAHSNPVDPSLEFRPSLSPGPPLNALAEPGIKIITLRLSAPERLSIPERSLSNILRAQQVHYSKIQNIPTLFTQAQIALSNTISNRYATRLTRIIHHDFK